MGRGGYGCTLMLGRSMTATGTKMCASKLTLLEVLVVTKRTSNANAVIKVDTVHKKKRD